MKKKNILFISSFYFLLFSFNFSLYSQENTLKAGFKDLPFTKIYLATVYGEKFKFVDSAKTDMTGGFLFKFRKNSKPGEYRLLVESKKRGDNGSKNIMDFIFNNENIEFYTTFESPAADINVVKSKENTIYFNYMTKRAENKNKIDVLNYVLANYPKTDDFYNVTEKKVDNLQKEQNKMIDDILKKYPDTYAARLVKMDLNIDVDPKLSEEQKKDYLKMHYFDKTDFTDSLLINSPAFTNKIISYLTLYSDKKNTRDQQEIAFIRAVDFIMKTANKNKTVYEFVLDYLISGFERFNFNKVINYIADNSRLDDFCQNDDKESTLELKIDSYKKFAVGKTVPDISINDVNGNVVKLSDIKTDYVLILFWASWCPHCEAMLPELKKIYDAQQTKKFEVLAVSIDDNKDDWVKAINKLNPHWINTAELKGWDGKTVKEYCVYATPTLYLIDKHKTIIAKPLSLDELENALN